MKAIIFDFDGTLTNSKKGRNAWVGIWEKINDIEAERWIRALGGAHGLTTGATVACLPSNL